jgi:hypothetical protein
VKTLTAVRAFTQRRAARMLRTMASPAPTTLPSPTPIRIGISACLLGRTVRFDGGHKKNAFLTDTLADYV